MKKFILLAIVFTFTFQLSTFNCSAQVPDWIWAKSSGGSRGDEASSVAVDALGNTYMAGFYNSASISFGSHTINNCAPGYADVFLAKYDAGGNVLWAKTAGGTGGDFIKSIAVDKHGNTYVAGYFDGPTIVFGSITLPDSGFYNIFLAKYDVNGNVLWAKSYGTYDDRASSVAVDTAGNIFLAGFYDSYILTLDTITLTNNGDDNFFIAKFNSNGNVQWAKSAGGTEVDRATCIAVDIKGNAYLGGYFTSSSVVFGSTTLSNASSTNYSDDIFLAKYSTSGNIIFAESFGGANDDAPNSIAVDTSGKPLMTGYFDSPNITFGATTLTNAGTNGFVSDIFLTKFDVNGNVIWSKSAGGINTDIANSVVADVSGNVYIAGYFNSASLTFGSTTLTNDSANGYFNLFLTKYDVNGNVKWAKSAGNTGDDEANAIAVNATGNIFMTGYYSSPGITLGSTTLTNAGSGDIFLAKLDSLAEMGINELSNTTGITVYPNPATDNIEVSSRQEARSSIEILNIEGQILQTFATTGNKTIVDISSLAKGIYFIKVKTENGIMVNKFIKE